MPAGSFGWVVHNRQVAPTLIVPQCVSRRNGLRLVGVDFTAGAGFPLTPGLGGFC